MRIKADAIELKWGDFVLVGNLETEFFWFPNIFIVIAAVVYDLWPHKINSI